MTAFHTSSTEQIAVLPDEIFISFINGNDNENVDKITALCSSTTRSVIRDSVSHSRLLAICSHLTANQIGRNKPSANGAIPTLRLIESVVSLRPWPHLSPQDTTFLTTIVKNLFLWTQRSATQKLPGSVLILSQLIHCVKAVLAVCETQNLNPAHFIFIAGLMAHRSHLVRSQVVRLLASWHQVCQVEDGGASLQGLMEAINWFTDDDVASVRADVLDTLTCLGTSASCLFVPSCVFERAQKCLCDKFEDVRLASLKLIASLASKSAPPTISTTDKPPPHDHNLEAYFFMVCSMATDMCPRVREATFFELGHFPVASITEESISVCLAKKVAVLQGSIQEASHKLTERDRHISAAAGAFVHGLEDEFAEVRIAALERLAAISGTFPGLVDRCIPHLVDAVNDESEAVRVQSLQVMLTLFDQIKGLSLPEEQMDIVLSCLSESNFIIQRSALAFLSKVKLLTSSQLKKVVRKLLDSLQNIDPETGLDLWLSVASIGASHGTLVQMEASYFVLQANDIVAKNGGQIGSQVYLSLILLIFSAGQSNPAVLSLVPQAMWKDAELLAHKLPQKLRCCMQPNRKWLGYVNYTL